MCSRQPRQGRGQAGGIREHRGWGPSETPRGASWGAEPRIVVVAPVGQDIQSGVGVGSRATARGSKFAGRKQLSAAGNTDPGHSPMANLHKTPLGEERAWM